MSDIRELARKFQLHAQQHETIGMTRICIDDRFLINGKIPLQLL